MPRIIDFKTGTPRMPQDSLQLFAYRKLAEVCPTFKSSKLSFDTETHAYTLDGSPVVSVTQLISQYLPNYFKDQKAAQRGTFVHKLCQQFVESGNINWVSINTQWPEITPYMSAFRDWYNQEKINQFNVLCETPLASSLLGFAGTIDLIIPEQEGIYNLYLKPDGKFDYIPREKEKVNNWNLVNSMLNVYHMQRRENAFKTDQNKEKEENE